MSFGWVRHSVVRQNKRQAGTRVTQGKRPRGSTYSRCSYLAALYTHSETGTTRRGGNNDWDAPALRWQRWRKRSIMTRGSSTLFGRQLLWHWIARPTADRSIMAGEITSNGSFVVDCLSIVLYAHAHMYVVAVTAASTRRRSDGSNVLGVRVGNVGQATQQARHLLAIEARAITLQTTDCSPVFIFTFTRPHAHIHGESDTPARLKSAQNLT